MKWINTFLEFVVVMFGISYVNGDLLFDLILLTGIPIQCKSNDTLTYTLGEIVTITSCNNHCKSVHGAGGGACDENLNCICSGDKVMDCIVGQTSEACACDALQPLVIRPIFDKICDSDCRCVHGAKAGVCNFGSQQCICDYTNFTWSQSTNQCAYKKVYTGTKYILELTQPILEQPILG